MKRIAFSFDDVPHYAGAFFSPDRRTETLIENLARAGIDQAAFFVVVGGLREPRGVGGEARIKAYTAAGHVIGSHSYSHPALSETSVEDYLADLDRAAAWFTDREGRRPWFRYPYIDEGDADPAKRSAVSAALADQGWSNAYITVPTLDWLLESLATPDMGLDALRDVYVESLLGPAEFYDELAVRALGRSPAHVFLLHENDVNALFIADAAAALWAAGWQIVSMDEAYRDPIAALEPVEWRGSGRLAGLALDRQHGIECDLLDHDALRRRVRALGKEPA
ncbi:polysaccharide deacetylase family protein [Kutzneria sp. 744]|uniref:polysaccharide deacetylase family protein n=1 Tax=Kutzneria sp. (strain 744) TaxID=345341 RepID=UPI0003EECAEE|nr:polysaccharide deacetylase family protein [Kutzneria sp. 744]EWM18766.1 polysaccharide deacetylase [Kutzneria sp. 744]